MARLHTVCWLELSFEMREVPAGRYLAYVRMNSDRRQFSGNWRVGVGSREISQFEPDAAINDNEAVTFISERDDSLPIGRWVYVIIGVLQISTGDSVQFHFLGGNPYWTCPIQFDHGGLIPIKVGWETKRLLLLGMLHSRGNRARIGNRAAWYSIKSLLAAVFGVNETSSAPCPIQLLNQDCLRQILRFL